MTCCAEKVCGDSPLSIKMAKRNITSPNVFHHRAHYTTERITSKNTKSLDFNLKYLNHYLIIFSKNLNISFYIHILVYIIILEYIT